MMENPEKKLQRHVPYKSLESDPETLADMNEWLDSDQLPLGGRETEPLEKPEHVKAELKHIALHQVKWIRNNLNLDVESRLPFDRKVLLFDPDNYKKLHKEGSRGQHSAGYIRGQDKAIFLKFTPSRPEGTYIAFGHELTHALSNTIVNLEKDGSETLLVQEKITGFQNTDKNIHRSLNEAFTELITYESLTSYKEGYLDRTYPGYVTKMTFIDNLIHEAANRLGNKPKELRFELYNAYFTGKMQALNVFEQVFGQGTLKKLQELDNIGSFQSHVELSNQIGMDGHRLQDQFDTLSKGDQITVCDSIPIRFPHGRHPGIEIAK